MALFNYATRELSAKIVYYGPGLSGKTTNIEMVHKILRHDQKGRLISLPTETDRTLFFDFLPIDLGLIKGFKVRFHLYTVPGQVFYNATRRLVLQGVDGVVFVADSQREMMNSNLESLKNLMENLSSYGKKLEELPFVLQYNKRDLRNIVPVGEMDKSLNFLRVPTYEAVAPAGKGVTETLVAISRLVFANLRKTLLMPGEMAAHEDIGELADTRIQTSFTGQEAELLEEISEVEEIPVVPEPAAVEIAAKEAGEGIGHREVDMEPASLRETAVIRPAPVEFEELGEIEVEVPKPPPRPPEEFLETKVRIPEPPPPAPEEFRETEGKIPEPPPPPPQIAEAPPPIPVAAEEFGEIEVEFPEPPPPPPPVAAAPPPIPVAAEEFGEIEVEFPEPPAAPPAPEPAPPPPAPRPASPAARPSVSAEVEGGGLTFLKFEAPSVTPEGHVMLTALFLDGMGDPVRVRIRISMEEE